MPSAAGHGWFVLLRRGHRLIWLLALLVAVGLSVFWFISIVAGSAYVVWSDRGVGNVSGTCPECGPAVDAASRTAGRRSPRCHHPRPSFARPMPPAVDAPSTTAWLR
jgi:hypothetical protein